MKRTISILLLFLGITLFSQETDAQKELLKKANENFELLNTNPEKAFEEAQKIEVEAQRINNKEAELRAINIQCEYYKTKNDFERLRITARSLFQKAESYKIPVYQLTANRFLFEAYIFSGLPEQAFLEIKQGIKLANNLNDKDSLIISSTADLFVACANYYILKKDYQNGIKYIKLSGKEYEKLPDGKYRQKLTYIYYSNLANVYNDLNKIDSAKFYAEFSERKDKGYKRSDIKSSNLFNLGNVALKKQDYNKALFYFKKAEKIKGYKNHLNIDNLYDNIIISYEQLQFQDSVKLYQEKKDSLKLTITENQNKSLHKLLDEKDNSNYKKYIYIFIFALIIMLCIVFFVFRKNRILLKQEKASQEYLNNTSKTPNGKDYSKLLKALKENDPVFMHYFEEAFPEFSSKLKTINTKISLSEIEFCALLKLKIPTKDIAKYQYIEPQSVRNKKHLIRKRLQIPKECDIYQFIDEL